MTRFASLVFIASFALASAGGAQTPTPTAGSGADTRKKYSAVLQQQGRVQTDADWNEKVAACRRENEELKRQLEKLRAENHSLMRQLASPATIRTPQPK